MPQTPPTTTKPPTRETLLAATFAAALLALCTTALLTRQTPTPRTLAATTQPTPLTPSDPHLEQAALAYTAGDLTAARQSLEQSTLTSPTQSPLAEALALAIKKDSDTATKPQELPPTPTPTPVPELPPEPTPPPTTPPPPTPPAPTQTTPAELQALLTRAAADARAGRSAKSTDAGQRALAAAKSAVSQKLSPAGEVTFPEDTDDRVAVVFNNNTYTIRSFADQKNQGKTPLRLPFLAKVKAVTPTDFELVSLEFTP